MLKKTKKQINIDEKFYHLTTVAADSLPLQEVLDELAETAVKITKVKACSIRLLDEDSEDLKMRSTYGLSEKYRNKGPVTKNDPVVKAAFEGQAVVLDDMRVDGRVKYKQATIKEGLVSQLTVVMKFREKAIGVLRLYSPKSKRFSEDDINLARSVASQCAIAITNARLYSKALEGARIAEQIRLAGIIQKRMIPQKAPRIKGLDIAATYIPCFDVGGDLYDFFQVTENRITVMIADVIGKGVPAAIMMSSFRGATRAYTDAMSEVKEELLAQAQIEGYEKIIQGIIKKLNKMVCKECKDGEFITFFHAAIDMREKTVTYCNCGHEPTILIRDGLIKDLNKGGLVLGVSEKAEYEIETLSLKNGDALLFYTDGLIDATSFEGEIWGRERMIEAARMFAAGSAEQMIKNILQYRRRFVGLARQIDDTSIIAVKVNKVTS
ncbi:MAG: SpoIIE family protein phosphatase [Planctomycetota bacterium]|jgi:sigma-B regulation protein RsbU (phosphoserine phosphatase)